MCPKIPLGSQKFLFVQFFFFFYKFASHFLTPHTAKKNTTSFFPFSHRKSQKPHVKRSPTKFFLDFFARDRSSCSKKMYHLPFFTKLRLRVPKNPAKRAQVSFSFLNYYFYAVIMQTHTHPHTLLFSCQKYLKNALNTFFHNLLFWFSTPSSYPQNTS